jgi:hypothetical protein
LGVGLFRPFGEGELNMSGVFVGRDRPGGWSGIVVFVAMDESDARILVLTLSNQGRDSRWSVVQPYTRVTGIYQYNRCRLGRPMERESEAHSFSAPPGRLMTSCLL